MIPNLAFMLATLLLVAIPAHSQTVEVNGIAAKVNGSVITKNEVNILLAPIYAQLAAQFPRRGPEFERQFNEARGKILQELIDRRIMLDEFKQIGASIRPSVIDEEVKRQIRENAIYSGNEAKFNEDLKKSRMTMEGFREMTREQMVVQAMRAQHFSDAPPPLPNEIQNAYNEMKSSYRDTKQDKFTFRKIFIPATDPENPVATPETQLALAEDIAKQAKEGKSFEELAKTYSKDFLAEQGGLQENLPRSELSPEFGAILFDAPENQVIGPLLDPRGFTIAVVMDKIPAPAPALATIRTDIENRVRKKKNSAQYERWIESRRKRAMITISKN